MNRATVRYFAILREQAKIEVEVIDAGFSVGEAYDALRRKHGFTMEAKSIRFAVNGQFVSSETIVVPGSEVVFIPPVAGG